MTEEAQNPSSMQDLHSVLTRLGKAYEKAGNNEKAEACYREVLNINNGALETAMDLGNLYSHQGRNKEAAIIYRYALSMGLETPVLFNNLACVLKEECIFNEAESNFRKAIALLPSFVEAMNNLGILLREQGRFIEAQYLYEEALRIKPDEPVVIDNLGSVFMEKGEYAKAEACFRQAFSLDPSFYQAGFDLAYVLLLTGRYEEGLEKYDLRLHRPGASYLAAGKPLLQEGQRGLTVLVRAEQGLGDTIHFARFLSSLKNKTAGKVIFECQKQLFDLLRSLDGADAVFPRKSDATPVDAGQDAQIPLLSLPRYLGVTVEMSSSDKPYINIDHNLIDKWKERLKNAVPEKNFRIGLAWAGNPKNAADRIRSIGIEQFLPLFEIDHIDFFSLQYGDKALSETQRLPGHAKTKLRLYTEDIEAFTETAALIMNLDLVITVDSVIGHLAGALGATVWNMLPFVPDWRWGLKGETTPWYPTMRLFRQTVPGEWDDIIKRIAAELVTIRKNAASACSLI